MWPPYRAAGYDNYYRDSGTAGDKREQPAGRREGVVSRMAAHAQQLRIPSTVVYFVLRRRVKSPITRTRFWQPWKGIPVLLPSGNHKGTYIHVTIDHVMHVLCHYPAILTPIVKQP